MPITNTVKVKAEPLLELYPIEEVKSSEFDNFSQPDLEDDTQFFIEEEEDDLTDREPLDELLEPLTLLLSLNHYLLDLNMFF